MRVARGRATGSPSGGRELPCGAEGEFIMKKQIVTMAAAAALALSLGACGGTSSNSSSSTSNSTSTTQSQSSSSTSDFDANAQYVGQWRGSVEITGQTVYGNASGSEAMTDLIIKDDGTCELTPLESHADLLTDTGTWEGTEDKLTLHLSSKDIELTVVDNATLTGNAADFGISDFDTITFDYYGDVSE